MNGFSETQNTLLSLLAQNLFSVPFTPAPDTDWEKVIRESKMQSVPSLAFKDYKSLALDEELTKDLESCLKQRTVSNLLCFKQHAYLHSLLRRNHIPYCMIKGTVSASYYPEPLLRGMGDVDFYVHPDDIERATEVILQDGFARTDINHAYHITLAKDRMRCEMHFEPVSVPYGEVGAVYREYWQDIIESAQLFSDGITAYMAPTAFHHGLITLAHFQGHLVSEGIGLRHFCDFAVFANTFSDEEFTAVFREKLKRVGLWRLATLLGLAASEYMGMPYRSWMGDDRGTAAELMADILAGGNFGRKDGQRAYEGLLISDRGKNGVHTNRFVQIIISLNNLTRNYWKIVDKLPILYPVGWVYFSVRYLVRLLLGKRKLNVSDALKQSERRRAFYAKLRLFEPEE